MGLHGDEARRPVIVSVAFNDLEYDSRVRAIASTLRRTGATVITVGITRETSGWERDVEGVSVLVLPVPILGRWRAAVLSRAGGTVDAVIRRLVGERRRRVDAARSRLKARRKELRRSKPGEGRRRATAALEDARKDLKRVRPGRVRRGTISGLRKLRRRLRLRAAEVRSSRRLKARSWAKLRRRLVREVVRRRPDAIHANGADGLSIAGASRRWLRLLGRNPVVIYDADEWTVGRKSYVQPLPGSVGEIELERRWIHTADAVITVSEPLARALREHHRLDATPALVQSAPVRNHNTYAPDLAGLAKLPAGAVTLIYIGRIADRRGVGDAISALPLLPGDVHLVLLGMGSRRMTEELVACAEALGVTQRLRIVDPVGPELVVGTIRGAAIGLLPLHHNDQHHVAMPNKLFQYAQAGLPIVCSDCEQPTKFVRDLEIGEIFAAGDPKSLAAAVMRALRRRDEIRARLEDPELRWATSWESQESRLIEVFRSTGGLPTPLAES